MNKVFTDYTQSTPTTGDYYLLQRGLNYFKVAAEDVARAAVSGTANKMARYVSANTLGDSTLGDDGTNVSVPVAKYITGSSGTKSRIDMNYGGADGTIFITTDGATNAESSLYMDSAVWALGVGGNTTGMGLGGDDTVVNCGWNFGSNLIWQADKANNLFKIKTTTEIAGDQYIKSAASKGSILFDDTNSTLKLSNDHTAYTKGYMWLENTRAFFGFNQTSILLNSNQGTVGGSVSFKGLVYDADYSANFTSRSLVDKAYVDATVLNTSWKTPVRAATTANITLSGIQTVDGVALIAGDRVLVKNQTTATDNGIYIVAAGAWARATDADTATELVGATLWVNEGTNNGDKLFTCSNDSITLGSTNITFVQSGAGTSYTNGTGIDISGNIISISSSYVGQNTITTLGTITTGVWNGTAISAAYTSGLVKTDGSTPLTADWAIGSYSLTGVKSLGIAGTAGNGYAEFLAQSSNSTAPASTGFRLFSGSAGAMAWARKNGTDTYVRSFDSTLTADRTYTLPDASTTLLGRTGTNAANQLSYFNDANQVTSSSNLDYASNCLRSLKTGSASTDVSGRFGHISFQSFDANNHMIGGNYTYNGGRYATGFANYIQFFNGGIYFGTSSSSAGAGVATGVGSAGVILPSGDFVIGSNATVGGGGIELVRSSNARARIVATNSSTGNAAVAQVDARNNGGYITTIGTHGSGYTTAGSFQANAGILYSDAPNGLNINAADATGGTIRFYTGGTASGNLWAYITGAGNKVLGNGALATNATNGFAYLTGVAGKSTGTPTSITGMVPIVIDTNSNSIGFYANSEWQYTVKSFKATYTAAQWKTIGSAPLVCVAAAGAGIYLALVPGTLCIKKASGTAYSFTGATYIGLGYSGANFLSKVTASYISSGAVSVMGNVEGNEMQGFENDYLAITTDNGADSSVGAGSVTVSFKYMEVNLN